jgi:hypothetical protein
MPSVTKKVVPPSISSGSRGWWVSTRPACGREGPRPTSRSTAVLGPGAGPAPNILRPSTGRADVRLRLLHHRRARVDLATLFALLPAPHIEREDPLVQLHAADAERVLLTLVGPSDVSVERHRQLEPERAHRTLLGFRGSRDGHFSWVISQPSTTPRNQRPTAHPREPVDAATWRRILLDQPQRNKTTSQVRHPAQGPTREIRSMADISISPLAPREFRVQVREGDRETTHQVTVPDRLGKRLELRDDDLERVVRESFHFLLERERATSILAQFSLSDISRYFPEYPNELARRLS